MTIVAISGKVEILCKNAFHRSPCIIDVARRTPRVSHLCAPCARESPTTHIIYYIFLATILDGIRDFRVLFTFVKSHVIATAIIHLDEIKIPITEIELTILLFMSCKANTYSPCVFIARTASIISSITIDTSLQTQRVDIIHQCTHTMREQLHV